MEKIDKLEEKIDKVKDEVTDVKVDVAEIKTLVKVTHEQVEEHIAGDNKIINQLVPILDQLGEMVVDHAYVKEQKKRRDEKLKLWSMRLSITGVSVGIITGLAKLLELF